MADNIIHVDFGKDAIIAMIEDIRKFMQTTTFTTPDENIKYSFGADGEFLIFMYPHELTAPLIINETSDVVTLTGFLGWCLPKDVTEVELLINIIMALAEEFPKDTLMYTAELDGFVSLCWAIPNEKTGTVFTCCLMSTVVSMGDIV